MDHDAAARLLHRPSDPATLKREAVLLMLRGLSLEDAAAAIGLTPAALYELLGDVEPQPDFFATRGTER